MVSSVRIVNLVQNGKLGHSCTNVTKGKLYGSRQSRDSDHSIVHLGLNVSSSAHNCGCVVDGGNAMAAISVLLLFILTGIQTVALFQKECIQQHKKNIIYTDNKYQ